MLWIMQTDKQTDRRALVDIWTMNTMFTLPQTECTHQPWKIDECFFNISFVSCVFYIWFFVSRCIAQAADDIRYFGKQISFFLLWNMCVELMMKMDDLNSNIFGVNFLFSSSILGFFFRLLFLCFSICYWIAYRNFIYCIPYGLCIDLIFLPCVNDFIENLIISPPELQQQKNLSEVFLRESFENQLLRFVFFVELQFRNEWINICFFFCSTSHVNYLFLVCLFEVSFRQWIPTIA